MIEITEAPIDHAAVTERVRSNLAGAVCTFLGTVRELTGDRRTRRSSTRPIPRWPSRRWPSSRPRPAAAGRSSSWRWSTASGDLDLGEVSVVVAVSCPHRQQAFEACRWLIDTLKEVVPIWKKENWADGGEEWVHPGSA